MRMTMTKNQLKEILDKYIEAENEITELNNKHGVRVYDCLTENFYNKYNWIIFHLLRIIFGDERTDLIESSILDRALTFDELWEKLNANE